MADLPALEISSTSIPTRELTNMDVVLTIDIRRQIWSRTALLDSVRF